MQVRTLPLAIEIQTNYAYSEPFETGQRALGQFPDVRITYSVLGYPPLLQDLGTLFVSVILHAKRSCVRSRLFLGPYPIVLVVRSLLAVCLIRTPPFFLFFFGTVHPYLSLAV